MLLSVTVTESKPGTFIITPVGSIDSMTYMILEKEVNAILRRSPTAVIFDMAGVAYISSMGVRVILKTSRALRNNAGKLGMVNLQPQIKKVFDIINVLPSQDIFIDRQELDKYLSEIQRKEVEGSQSL